MYELAHTTLGVDVLSMNVPDSEHGLSMRDPVTGRVAVAVATTPHPMRQRSSIAHELGHIVAGDLDRTEPLVPGERSPEEMCADAFARHLLLPLTAVRRRFSGREGRAGLSLTDLSDLVQEFEVSPMIAAIQLRTLHLIEPDVCRVWGARSASNLAVTFGWGGQYYGLAADSATPRAPQSLMARAVVGYQRGVLGINELASWYGREHAELEQELDGPYPDSFGSSDDEWDDDAPLFASGTRGDAGS